MRTFHGGRTLVVGTRPKEQLKSSIERDAHKLTPAAHDVRFHFWLTQLQHSHRNGESCVDRLEPLVPVHACCRTLGRRLPSRLCRPQHYSDRLTSELLRRSVPWFKTPPYLRLSTLQLIGGPYTALLPIGERIISSPSFLTKCEDETKQYSIQRALELSLCSVSRRKTSNRQMRGCSVE